jgi:hypothetical protein
MRIAETGLNIIRETAKPFHVEITGKRRDTETVMRRLEGGDWKSASNGNSLVAYPTTCMQGSEGREGDISKTFSFTRFQIIGGDSHGKLICQSSESS